MTPKEKAKELYKIMANNLEEYGWQQTAKEQAIYCVDEILNLELTTHQLNYWQDVKKELKGL